MDYNNMKDNEVERGYIISTQNRHLVIIGTEVPIDKGRNKGKEFLGYEFSFDEKIYGRFIRADDNFFSSGCYSENNSIVKSFSEEKKLAMAILTSLRNDLNNKRMFKTPDGSDSWMMNMEPVKVYSDVRKLEEELHTENLF